MRIQTYLPEEVRSSILLHVNSAVKAAVEAHESAQEEEDALTGQLGAFLRTRRPIEVVVGGRTWVWAINYHKFRGRGPKATEHIIGADGLIEFSLDDVEQHIKKTCLFQAKVGKADLQRLLAQSILLTTWKEAAFILNFAPDGYTALELDEALTLALRLGQPKGTALGEFLTDSFIACIVGDSELHYEPAGRILRWRDLDGQVVHTAFSVRHRFYIRVEGPGRFSYLGTAIDIQDIHTHRMEASDEEILGINRDAALKDVQRARRQRSKVYHTDKHQKLEAGSQSILEMRMKETNAAADRVQARVRREARR